MTHHVHKQECSLCGVKGETETYWNATTGKYHLLVKCENPMCIGNRLK